MFIEAASGSATLKGCHVGSRGARSRSGEAWPEPCLSTVAQTPGSHAIYVSQPKVVADLIRAAVAKVASSDAA